MSKHVFILKRAALFYQFLIRPFLVSSRNDIQTLRKPDEQSGAVEACWAHIPAEVRGSKPRSAKIFFQFQKHALLILIYISKTKKIIEQKRLKS